MESQKSIRWNENGHVGSYSKFGRITNFRFASDVSMRNSRVQNKCQTDILLNWKKQLQSSCYSNPLVYPLHQDGKDDVDLSMVFHLQILIAGFWKYVDVVSQNGNSFDGWPQDLGNRQFYSPPFAYDLNGDGIDEIILLDADAILHIIQVVSFSPLNHQLDEFHAFKSEKVARLPPICIDRYWFESTTVVTSLESIVSFTTLPSITELELVLPLPPSPLVPLGGLFAASSLLHVLPLSLRISLVSPPHSARLHTRQPTRRFPPLHPARLHTRLLRPFRPLPRQVSRDRLAFPPTPLSRPPLLPHPRTR